MSENDAKDEKQAKAETRKEAKTEIDKIREAVSGELPKPAPKAKEKGVHPAVKNGAKTRFLPGHNKPGPGRPRKTLMTDALRQRLAMKFPARYAKAMGMPKGLTWAEAVAYTALYDLVKAPAAVKFEGYAARAEGPLVQPISGPDGGPIPLDIGVHEKLKLVTERLRSRIAKDSTE